MNTESIAHRTIVVASLYEKVDLWTLEMSEKCACVTDVVVCVGGKHGVIA